MRAHSKGPLYFVFYSVINSDSSPFTIDDVRITPKS